MDKKKLLKLLFSLLILYFLFSAKGQFAEAMTSLKEVNKLDWFLAVIVIAFTPFIAGIRTKLIAGVLGEHIRYRSCIYDCLVSATLNTLFFSGSGDLYRMNGLKKRGIAAKEAVGTVVFDRLWGIAALVCMAFGFAFYEMNMKDQDTPAVASVIILVVLLLMGLTFMLRQPKLGKVQNSKIISVIRDLILRSSAKRLVKIGLLSFLGSTFTLASVYLCARALDIDCSFSFIAVAASVAIIASMLPISAGGIGVREFSYVFLLEPAGVPPEKALALGIVQYSTFLGHVAIILICQFIYILYKKMRSTDLHLDQNSSSKRPLS